jgi:hypothetical protein
MRFTVVELDALFQVLDAAIRDGSDGPLSYPTPDGYREADAALIGAARSVLAKLAAKPKARKPRKPLLTLSQALARVEFQI